MQCWKRARSHSAAVCSMLSQNNAFEGFYRSSWFPHKENYFLLQSARFKMCQCCLLHPAYVFENATQWALTSKSVAWRFKSKSNCSHYKVFLPDCFLLVFHFLLPLLLHALVKRHKRHGEPRRPSPEIRTCLQASGMFRDLIRQSCLWRQIGKKWSCGHLDFWNHSRFLLGAEGWNL
jgi:hypothetical protein